MGLLLMSVIAGFGGCIRVAGSAGYWKTNADSEQEEYHGAGFDSQQLIAPKKQGSITRVS